MKNIIVAYPTRETALKIKKVLEREGFYVSHICGTGASVLTIADDMLEAVIICSDKLRDMSVVSIAEMLPNGFDVIALTHSGKMGCFDNLIPLPMPLEREDFIYTVSLLMSSSHSFTQRKADEADYIFEAKRKLCRYKKMSELQAHKYMQNESMRSGQKLVEIAKQIIEDYE